MKIEVGKFYKTRDGKKARIYATDGSGKHSIHGAVFFDNSWLSHRWTSYTWTDEGIYRNGDTDGLDLVSEWEEPKPKFKAWIHRTKGSICFHTYGECPDFEFAWMRAPWLDEP